MYLVPVQWTKIRKHDYTQYCQGWGKRHFIGQSLKWLWFFTLMAPLSWFLYPSPFYSKHGFNSFQSKEKVQSKEKLRPQRGVKWLYKLLRNNKSRVWRVTFAAAIYSRLDPTPKFPILLLNAFHETRCTPHNRKSLGTSHPEKHKIFSLNCRG